MLGQLPSVEIQASERSGRDSPGAVGAGHLGLIASSDLASSPTASCPGMDV